MKILIMAGGIGARLWPLSLDSRPKQFINFFGDESLLESTVRRFNKKSYDIWVCIQKRHHELAKTLLNKIDPFFEKKIIQEPYAKNTGPAFIWALKHLSDAGNLSLDEVVALVPADHFIEKNSLFLDLFQRGCEAAKGNKIVAFAITPRRVETGYGYFRLDGEIGDNIYKVNSFIEKPDTIMAKYLLDQGNVFWNSGIYIFQIGHFLSLIKKCAPIFESFLDGKQPFDALPARSIDRALIEKTDDLLVLRMQTAWSDLGSWESLCEILPKEEKHFPWGKIEVFPKLAAVSSDRITLSSRCRCQMEIFSKECWTLLEGSVHCGMSKLEKETQIQFDEAVQSYVENPFPTPAVWMRHRFSDERSSAAKNQ